MEKNKGENKFEKNSCCGNAAKKESKWESKGFVSGMAYGIIPHAGCIAFILFTILGMTAATSLFRPLLMNRYFFHWLAMLSFAFATISAGIYLKRRGMLSVEGIRQKKKYLSALYCTSIGINILLFMVIFPLAANMTGAAAAESSPKITLKVDIPCPGHAPLISESLKSLNGVKSVKYRFPDYFDVAYEPLQTNAGNLLSIDVFRPYPAAIVSQDNAEQDDAEPDNAKNYAANDARKESIQDGCARCSGAAGGYCTI